MKTLDDIRRQLSAGEFEFSHHAFKRVVERSIGDVEIQQAGAGALIIEDYPDDPRGASMLVLGYTDGGAALHTVCSFDPSGTLVMITVYVPEPPKWIDERTRGGKA